MVYQGRPLRRSRLPQVRGYLLACLAGCSLWRAPQKATPSQRGARTLHVHANVISGCTRSRPWPHQDPPEGGGALAALRCLAPPPSTGALPLSLAGLPYPPGFHVSSIRWPLPRRLLLAFPTGYTGVERTNTAHLQSVGSTCPIPLSQQLASNTQENSSARV